MYRTTASYGGGEGKRRISRSASDRQTGSTRDRPLAISSREWKQTRRGRDPHHDDDERGEPRAEVPPGLDGIVLPAAVKHDFPVNIHVGQCGCGDGRDRSSCTITPSHHDHLAASFRPAARPGAARVDLRRCWTCQAPECGDQSERLPARCPGKPYPFQDFWDPLVRCSMWVATLPMGHGLGHAHTPWSTTTGRRRPFLKTAAWRQ